MLAKNQITHVRTEREILTNSKIPWIVNLRYSFQDEMYLYLVMDFLPGGDLMSLLMKKDILTEDEARFYIAQLILAVESVHNMNCIHRDLKPDNILIDKNGHIQLSDFGLSKLADQSFYPMSTDLQKEDDITMHRPSNNIISENKLTRGDIKSKRKNRLVNLILKNNIMELIFCNIFRWLIQLLEPQIILHLRSSGNLVIVKKSTGGQWALFYSR
jgi:protein-serine/threonine kinase